MAKERKLSDTSLKILRKKLRDLDFEIKRYKSESEAHGNVGELEKQREDIAFDLLALGGIK